MFKEKEKRFVTKGIDAKVSKEIQIVCWELVDNLVKEKSIEVDYLQIFEFEMSESKLLITHRQEEPEYLKQYELKLEDSIVDFDVSKLWIIDNDENQTMLLPEEY
ncbi:DUF960 family protein [Vagococcus fluvialis]|uniref:DUF960 family protein n=1 Tax=Vagococcus fluvialis TaxID=2738 RepID=UPI003D0F9DDE